MDTAPGDKPDGINPGNVWTFDKSRNGMVYGFSTPVKVTKTSNVFQFTVSNTKYNISYSPHGLSKINVTPPKALPSFTQSFSFGQALGPLTFETGGYNAFITELEQRPPAEQFPASYRTPVISTDTSVDNLITKQGDFSIEFWHSTPVVEYKPSQVLTYAASDESDRPVSYITVNFDNSTTIRLRVNETTMRCITSPTVFTSGWRHFAFTYDQPYVMACNGDGFEVKQAGNFNFERDFGIIITFKVSDTTYPLMSQLSNITVPQGLLYKGTGSSSAPPELSMSYRVAVVNGKIEMSIAEGQGAVRKFAGPPVVVDKFHRLIINKFTNPLGQNPITDTARSAAPNLKSAIKVNNQPPSKDDTTTTIDSIMLSDPTTQDLIEKASKSATSSSSYCITFALQTQRPDGGFDQVKPPPTPVDASQSPSNPTADPNSAIKSTGPAHLLIGTAYDENGTAMPLRSDDKTNTPGMIQNVYLFKQAITQAGIPTNAGTVDFALASNNDLANAGLIGLWKAAYNVNGVIENTTDKSVVAASLSANSAKLEPLEGYESEGINLFLNGYSMPLTFWVQDPVPKRLDGPRLEFNAGFYKLSEISMWNTARQQFQILNDMFGRLIVDRSPGLAVYLRGIFDAPSQILPMRKIVDSVQFKTLAPNILCFNRPLFPYSVVRFWRVVDHW